jgi:AcrR family transcriptional regulator
LQGDGTNHRIGSQLIPEASEGSQSGLREKKKVETRAALQETAVRLFKENGFATTSVDQIAAAANVSRSTFFRYFGSKEAVLFARLDTSGELLVELLEARPPSEGPIRAFEEALVELITQTDGDSRRGFSQMFEEVVQADSALGSKRLSVVQRWSNRIAESFAYRRTGARVPARDDELSAAICIAVAEQVGRWRQTLEVTLVEAIREGFATLRRVVT